MGGWESWEAGNELRTVVYLLLFIFAPQFPVSAQRSEVYVPGQFSCRCGVGLQFGQLPSGTLVVR